LIVWTENKKLLVNSHDKNFPYLKISLDCPKNISVRWVPAKINKFKPIRGRFPNNFSLICPKLYWILGFLAPNRSSKTSTS